MRTFRNPFLPEIEIPVEEEEMMMEEVVEKEEEVRDREKKQRQLPYEDDWMQKRDT